MGLGLRSRERGERGGEIKIDIVGNGRERGRGGPCTDLRFPREGGGGGEGATLSPIIFNIFLYDISLITRKSNTLVSHFLHKDITKVISRVEID